MTASLAGQAKTVARAPLRRRVLTVSAMGFGGVVMLLLLLVVWLVVLLDHAPKTYARAANPIEPPAAGDYARFELDGFESPYLGHTGSWNGKGGSLLDGSKVPDLEKEVDMGLRWTFMPVYWSALEPDGPVDPLDLAGAAWRSLDSFVVEAQKRRLNVFMQVVIGGNAGGPPGWAGRREAGKSAPADMEAAAAFAGKLAARYAPGGQLATQQGWGRRYGVRAWELDNEPDIYLTHWNDQAGDYAEFATRAAARIKEADPQAMILGPATTNRAVPWIGAALDAHRLSGSPTYRQNGQPYSIGPVVDGVSFHLYEGLDTLLASADRTVERVLEELRITFVAWETGASGFHYERKREFWHTEGNFDFIGFLPAERRAAWRIQFMTRAFAAGLRKVCVMDVSEPEQAAVRGYVRALPWPFPMLPAEAEVQVLRGHVVAFRHPDGETPQDGQVWVLWAHAGTGDAEVEIPLAHERVTVVHTEGTTTEGHIPDRRLRLTLKGDGEMAPPLLVIDRPG
ncbi:MAG TPA: glycoside hydrolase family 44 protein [Chloroflexota bacterium]|nr:glycoside hydrolase family 44 protein [Chloroflexota bacterium]